MKKWLLLIVFLQIFSMSLFANNNLLENQNVFIENNGQSKHDYNFYAKSKNEQIFVKTNSIVFNSIISKKDSILVGSSIELEFVGAIFDTKNMQSNIISTSTFFKGANTKAIEANKYQDIIFREIYPDVNLRIYFDNEKFRYDLIVNSNTNVENIQIKVHGTDKILKDSINSNLTFKTSNLEFYHKNLEVYSSNLELQKSENQKVINNRAQSNIDIFSNQNINQVLNIENNSFSYNLKKIKENTNDKYFVIDPIIYSSYLGGESYDYVESQKIYGNIKDTSKKISFYIAGYTSSLFFPTTIGAYRENLKSNINNDPDCFIANFDSSGKLLHSTYFGSFADDRLSEICLDSLSNVYATGYTFKTATFPVTDSCYQKDSQGFFDSFITKFDPTLTRIIASTKIGGGKDDFAQAIVLDNNSNPVISGITTHNIDSLFYPSTGDAIQNVTKGKYDIFVSKLDSTLKTLIFSTFLGGREDDYVNSMIIDKNNNIYLSGSTKSSDFPTLNAFDNIYNDSIGDSSLSDIFVSKINLNFSSLEYSTFFGGTKKDNAYEMCLDNLDNLIITGTTESDDFVVSNALDSSYNTSAKSKAKGDVFITKFDDKLNLLFSTYIGGTEADRAFSVDVDSLNNIYITGSTNSMDYPITLRTFSDRLTDTINTDVFITKVFADGSKIDYSTYINGTGNDLGKNISVLDTNLMIISGNTSSKDFMIVGNAFDISYNDSSSQDVFISIFKTIQELKSSNSKYSICFGDSIQIESTHPKALEANSKLLWSPKQSLTNDTIINPIAFPFATTQYTLVILDSTNTTYYDTLVVEVVPLPKPVISGENTVVLNNLYEYNTNFKSGAVYTWTVNGGNIEYASTQNNMVKIRWTQRDSASIVLYESSPSGCQDSVVFKLKVFEIIEPKVIIIKGSPQKCLGDTLLVDAGSYFKNIVWNNGITGRYNTILYDGKYFFRAKDSKDKNVISDTIVVKTISAPPYPVIKYKDGELVCVTLADYYQWYFGDNLIAGATNRNYKATQVGYYKVRISNKNGCYKFSDLVNDIDNDENENFETTIQIQDNLIKIESQNEIKRIELFDLLGRPVEMKFIENNIYSKVLSIDNRSLGLYNLIISDNLGNKSYKFCILE